MTDNEQTFGGGVGNAPDVSTGNPLPVVNYPLYEEQQAMGPFAYALFLETKLREARDLVNWFALKWHQNNPLFPDYDEMTDTVLPQNASLSRTWYEVVRGGVRCEGCQGRRYSTAPTENDRVVTVITCEVCDGTGFIKSEGQPEERGPGIDPGHQQERYHNGNI